MRLSAILVSLSGAAATVGYCNDKDNSCAAWALDGECEGENSEHVKNICPHTCGVCTIMCSDREDNCASWAKEGQCADNKDYMHKECQTSCGLCVG